MCIHTSDYTFINTYILHSTDHREISAVGKFQEKSQATPPESGRHYLTDRACHPGNRTTDFFSALYSSCIASPPVHHIILELLNWPLAGGCVVLGPQTVCVTDPSLVALDERHKHRALTLGEGASGPQSSQLWILAMRFDASIH
ncbi:hypothetical protein AGOR_G00150230 [Albula goreensis]|uniref:Uncharacterized protein n=1 Tax=Albula goreensis TaxID=1534307 RepID=A0A8T3D8W5_9TELE|nr:hypothetical protein AGOR_G00150230 [Albula goreensis]